MNHSVRHGGTDEVSLQISQTNDHLVVIVRDAGTSDGAPVPGVGLNSMRERAAEIGGTLEVTSNGSGSLVRALLPLG